MTPLATHATKELRALFPAWLACTLAAGAGAFVHEPKVLAMGVFAYVAGSLALGAQSIGHEYSHRTLPMLLALPVDRRRVLLTKLAVLLPLLLVLTAIQWAAFLNAPHMLRRAIAPEPSTRLLLVLCAIALAPWLTMVCRSPLAGAVFAFSLPATILVAGDLIGGAIFGFGAGADVDRFKFGLVRWGTLALCVVGAAAGWRMFTRLEALESGGPELRLPRWLRRRESVDVAPAVGARRHPVWLLIKKELRVQQMTFAIAGLYVAGWTAMTLVERLSAGVAEFPIGAVTLLYFALLAMVIGALASAEERQFGTVEWQMLLPMAAWKQWAVKVGTAFALALVLGVGMPLALAALHPSGPQLDLAARGWRDLSVVVVLVTACALYVSSLSTGGVKALVVSLPVAVGVIVLISAATSAMWWMLTQFFSGGRAWASATMPDRVAAIQVAPGAIAAIVMVILLRLALVNHRTSDRSAARISRQLASIAALLTASVLAVTGVLALWLLV